MALINYLCFDVFVKENIYHPKMVEEETRDQIEESINNELPKKEAAIETIIEEEKSQTKTKT